MWSRACKIGFRCMAVGSLALGAGGVFYEQTNKHFMAKERAELHGRIVDAQRLIADVEGFEPKLPVASHATTRLNTNLPSGSAQIWLPELIRNHFTAAGLDVAIVRLNSLHDIPEEQEYQRGYWSVGLPIHDSADNIPKLLSAVALFEKQNSFIHVLDLSISADPESPGKRIAGINVTTLVAK